MWSLRIWWGIWKDGDFQRIHPILKIKPIFRLLSLFFLKTINWDSLSWNNWNLPSNCLLINSLSCFLLQSTLPFQEYSNSKESSATLINHHCWLSILKKSYKLWRKWRVWANQPHSSRNQAHSKEEMVVSWEKVVRSTATW